MKQTIFETRQRAEELLKEAISVWRQSDQDEQLEGLENDPVFKMLLTALAYQANETNGQMETLKEEVVEEFLKTITPFEVGRATPATMVIETQPGQDIQEITIDQNARFSIAETEISFIPLTKTNVIAAEITSVVRLDGRRWKVTMAFPQERTSIEGMAFTINNKNFHNLKISINKKDVDLTAPWELEDLPLNNCFSLDTVIYNQSQAYEAQATCLDLFTKQNVRMFFIKKGKTAQFKETTKIEMTFEFNGINQNFEFNKNVISLNTMILVNAQLNSATLSSYSPIIRAAGYEEGKDTSTQFLHAIRPQDTQIYAQEKVEIRRVEADRFNQASLLKLLNTIIARYHSDYFAFKYINGIEGDKTISQLYNILKNLLNSTKQGEEKNAAGVYMMLQQNDSDNNVSLDISYLTTNGAYANRFLSIGASLITPGGLNASQTRQIAKPVQGQDEVRGDEEQLSLARYLINTNDRIITNADIKIFCINELITRYGIARNMIKDVKVSKRLQQGNYGPGYEIYTQITLVNNTAIRKGFEDKIQETEIILEKMMQTRSANIYPIIVRINLENIENN